MEKRTLNVVCAIIIKNNRYFLARRPHDKHHGGFWEFPGGKVQASETTEFAIAREIKEELNIRVEATEVLEPVFQEQDELILKLIPIKVRWVDGEVKLFEHSESSWYRLEDILSLNLCPGDAKIVKRFLQNQ